MHFGLCFCFWFFFLFVLFSFFFLALKVIIWKQALYLLVGSRAGKGKMEREGNWVLRNIVNKYLWAVTKMTVRKFSDELSKKCCLLFRGLQLFKSTLASESSHNSQYWQMVLKTRAGNQHGFDPLLPLQALQCMPRGLITWALTEGILASGVAACRKTW